MSRPTTVTPSASAGTRSRSGSPASEFAATTNEDACSPASTGTFTPVSTNPPPSATAVVCMRVGCQETRGSSSATATSVVPAISPATRSAWPVPAADKTAAATFAGTKGPGATNRPRSYAARARSCTPSPDRLPPAHGLGNEHRRPAELGRALPPLPVEPGRVVLQGPNDVEWAGVVQEAGCTFPGTTPARA